MNFYGFNIGDYAAHTGHLEPMEDLAYRRLLDLYYLREAPLPIDASECAKLIRMRGSETIVGAILAEFFTLSDAGWTQVRCEQEIAAFRVKSGQARANANKRWHSAGNASAEQVDGDSNANAMQTQCVGNATNPTTTTTTNKPPRTPRGGCEGFEEFYAAYPKHEAKKAAQKAWDKLRPDEALRRAILKAIETQSSSEQWRKDGGKYIPLPASWLNAERWSDSIRLRNKEPPVNSADETYRELEKHRLTPEQKAAADRVRQMAMSAVKIITQPKAAA